MTELTPEKRSGLQADQNTDILLIRSEVQKIVEENRKFLDRLFDDSIEDDEV